MSGFNRKRRFGNDDYQERYQKRVRLPPIVELAKSLCGDLNTLGESSTKYVEDVEFMSVPIVSNFEEEKVFRDAVLSTIFAITTEQPQKIPHISGLILIVNSQSPTVGKTIIEFFHQKAQEILNSSTDIAAKPESFETGSWNKLKLILRLLSTLSFIIKPESLIDIYKQFLNLSIDLQNQYEKRSPLAEAIFYNTLLSIPFLTIYQPDFNKELIQSLVDLADKFKIVESNVTITTPFSENSPFEQKELITLILPALKAQLENPTDVFIDLKEALKAQLEDKEKHELPQFSFPTVEALKETNGLDRGLGSVDGMWRTPRLTFQVYLPTEDFLTTPPTDTYFGLLTRDVTTDIVEALEYNRKEVARQIITLDLFFKNGLFAEAGSSIDTLKEVHKKNLEQGTNQSTWKIEDVAVETVLSLIYKLPTASQPSVYFYTVLVEACTNASQAIAPVMGRAIRYFYANLINLDFELRLRYLDWLSVQLSNFNFTWKWREWENDAERFGNSNYHPKIVFIKNLIAKELRLTSKEKIESTLTEPFHKYLDTKLFTNEDLQAYYNGLFPEAENLDVTFDENSKFFFIRDGTPLKEKVQELIEAVHKDNGEGEYVKVIDEIKQQVESFPNSEKLLISILFQTIAFIGNRSITHANRYFSATSKALKSLITESSDKDAELYAIDAVLKYWNTESHIGFLVVDILESLEIISPLSKLRYVLDDKRSVNFGVADISAIESVFRTLKSSLYSKNGYEELVFTFKSLTSVLTSTLSKLSTEEAISIPESEAENDEINELQWKYHTVLGFIRSILRSYSDEYSGVGDDLKTTISEINHKPTISTIESWIDELKEL